MNRASLADTLTLCTITGMRSMSGPAALALARGGISRPLLGVLAAGEMIVDKTSFVGDRTDAVPLAGRAVMGALVGGWLARERGGSAVLGGLLGAATAVAATHLAYQARKRLPFSTAVNGLIEDGIVAAVAGSYAARARTVA